MTTKPKKREGRVHVGMDTKINGKNWRECLAFCKEQQKKSKAPKKRG